MKDAQFRRTRVEVLKALCLEPLNLTVTEAARALGVSRKTLSSILNGRAGYRVPKWPCVCLLLSTAVPKAGSTNSYNTDLWHAEKGRSRLRVERLSAA